MVLTEKELVKKLNTIHHLNYSAKQKEGEQGDEENATKTVQLVRLGSFDEINTVIVSFCNTELVFYRVKTCHNNQPLGLYVWQNLWAP
jgi:hypothetical protein